MDWDEVQGNHFVSIYGGSKKKKNEGKDKFINLWRLSCSLRYRDQRRNWGSFDTGWTYGSIRSSSDWSSRPGRCSWCEVTGAVKYQLECRPGTQYSFLAPRCPQGWEALHTDFSSNYGGSVTVLVCFSAAVIKTMAKGNLREERVYFSLQLPITVYH